jgi:hypothetical protein
MWVFPLWQDYRRLKKNIQAIFDTLISRTQLRDRMIATSTDVDLGFPSTQVESYFNSPNMWPNWVVDRRTHSHGYLGGSLALW